MVRLFLPLHDWLILTLTCLAGAVSPGPSVVLLIRHVSASGVGVGAGVGAGVVFGVFHGFGVLVYAGLVAFGLASVLLVVPGVFLGVQLAGLGFLVWIGWGMFWQGMRDPPLAADMAAELGGGVPQRLRRRLSLWRAGVDGFLIALLNPKVAVFFTAIFSQFLAPHQPLTMRMQMAVTAWLVDSLWYIFLAVLFGMPFMLRGFRAFAPRLNVVMGAGLMLLALIIGGGLLRGIYV